MTVMKSLTETLRPDSVHHAEAKEEMLRSGQAGQSLQIRLSLIFVLTLCCLMLQRNTKT
jgi:hypothetical protein